MRVQEEERERRLDFVPEKSKVDIDQVISVTQDAEVMLRNLGVYDQLQSNLHVQEKVVETQATNTRAKRN